MVKQLMFLCFAGSAILAQLLGAQVITEARAAIAEASRLQTTGKLAEAEMLLRSSLENLPQDRQGDAVGPALMSRLGIILQQQGRLSEAEQSFRQAASQAEALFGSKHEQFAIALGDLGGVLVEEGRYQEAYSLIRQALDIAVPVLGDCDLKVAFMYSHLGQLFYWQKELARALPVARRVLFCIEKQPGAETIEAAEAHQNLAAVYVDDRQYSLAQEHLDRAKAIWTKFLPPDHPHLLIAKNTQLALYYKQGRFKEARELGLELIEQARKRLGSGHPTIAVMLANIGCADQKLKLYGEAAKCLREAIAIEEAVNPQSSYLADLLRFYAGILRDTHCKPEAKQLESRAKAILASATH